VPVTFELVRKVCGNFDDGHCAAQKGAPCDTKGCPYLAARTLRASGPTPTPSTAGCSCSAARPWPPRALSDSPPRASRRRSPDGGRRQVAELGLGHVARALRFGIDLDDRSHGRHDHRAGGCHDHHHAGGRPAGTRVGPAKDVPVGGSASFQLPSSGDPGLMLQLSSGSFLAYDAICPHAGCTVGYSSAAKLIVCPCHGSEFNPSNGDVIQGPAPEASPPVPVF